MPATAIRALPRTSQYPFPEQGISRSSEGIASYDELPETLVDVLVGHAERTPGVEAVVEIGGDRLDYASLLDRASSVAGGLRALGVEPGDRVAIRHPAGLSWVEAFWGVLLAGGVVVAVNTRFAPPEVEFVLADAGVRVDLVAGEELPVGEPYVYPGGRADDIAGLFYTSGTTGRPRGVPTTHRAFLSNAETMIRCLGIPRDEGAALRTLISVPLFHVTGCNAQLLTAAYVGGTSVVLPALDPAVLLESLVAERISFVVTVPAVYALLLRHPSFASTPVDGVRWVGYGGAPIPSSLVRSLKAAFSSGRVFNGFGMTESASILTVLPHDEADLHADSVGYPAPVVDLALAELDGPAHGELLARGPNVAGAYWNDVSPQSFEDGWLHTGDIVTVDDAGRIRIVDRLKDMINRGGENVASVEVEDALADAPGVLEAAVIGVPDDVMGEKVGVVLHAEADDFDVAAVLDHVRARLADYKVPQYAVVVQTPLPRNAAGKLLKTQLRETVEWGPPLR